MKRFFILPLLILCASSQAQIDDAAKFAGVIRTSELQKHLKVIASDEMEGRETGTAGQRKAAAYIEDFFKSAGFSAPAPLKTHQQLYPLYRDSIVSVSLVAGTSTATYGSDYISPIAVNEQGKFKGKKIAFAGYGISDKNYNDYATIKVKGKVVVILSGEPKKDGNFLVSGSKQASDWSSNAGLTKKIALAAEKGATVVLLVNTAQETFTQRVIDGSKKTNQYYPRATTPNKINYLLLTHAFAKKVLGNNIEAALAKAKTGSAFEPGDYFQQKNKTAFTLQKSRTTTMASNVLGVIEGSDKKDEYVFVTAHYDHIGISASGQVNNGADDDGSGTVAVMQIGEAFLKAKAEGKGPRRTVVIMTVSGEEKGLWGSEYYSDNPVFPLAKTTVDLNIDMIGRIDTERMKDDSLNYVYVVGHDKLSTDLPLINEAANNKYTGLVLDYKYDDPADPNRIYFRSDHYNFARKGVPVLFFYDGMLKSDYHRPGDDVEKIYWPLLEKRARMVFHTAWEMANKETMLKRDIPLGTATR